MALKKNAGSTPAAAPGGFEDEGGTTTAATPTQDTVAAAKVEGTTAVAKAAATSLVASGGFKDIFKELEGKIPPVEFGTLARIVGVQGSVVAKLAGNKQIDLGSKITAQLLSFHSQYTISPGDDSKDAKEFVEYSLDGVTIDRNGKNVDEYLKHLQEVEGYEKANKKRYVYLTVLLTGQTGGKDGEELVGDIVEVSLSPQGVQAWDAFRLQRSAKIAMGTVDAATAANIQIIAEKRSGNGNNWCVLVVKPDQ